MTRDLSDAQAEVADALTIRSLIRSREQVAWALAEALADQHLDRCAQALVQALTEYRGTDSTEEVAA